MRDRKQQWLQEKPTTVSKKEEDNAVVGVVVVVVVVVDENQRLAFFLEFVYCPNSNGSCTAVQSSNGHCAVCILNPVASRGYTQCQQHTLLVLAVAGWGA